MYEVTLPTGQSLTVKDFTQLKSMAMAGMFDADASIFDKTQNYRFRAGDHPVISKLLPPPPRPVAPPPPPAPKPTGPAAGYAPAPSAPSVHSGMVNADNSYVSEEMTRQYVACNWWVFWGVLALFGFFTSIISIVFFIYAVIRKQSIRQRAAELGINPDDIAMAANARFWQTGGPILKVFGILAACFVGLIVLTGIFGGMQGCSQTASDRERIRLVGAWQGDYGAGMNLNAGGRGQMTGNQEYMEFTWKAEDGHLKMYEPNSGNLASDANYSLSSDARTLHWGNRVFRKR